MSRTWALVCVVVSAACFGTLGVLTSLAYRSGAQPLPLLAWRFVFASALLALLAFMRDPAALKITRRELIRYAVLAITGYGAASVCFFYALKFADASLVTVLLYAYPSLVCVVGWVFLGERATWMRIAAVAITFAGCALVVGVGSAELHASWQGIALGLGAAVGYTAFNLLSHRWMPQGSRMGMMAYTFGIAAFLPAVGVIAVEGFSGLSPSAWSGITWLLLGGIVLIPTFAAIVLYLEGIKGLGPSQAAVVSTFEPIFTIVLAGSVLHERLAPIQVGGAALVILGVVASELRFGNAQRGPHTALEEAESSSVLEPDQPAPW